MPRGFTQHTIAGRPAWHHDATGIDFRPIPAGTHTIGLTDDNIATLKAIAATGYDDDYIQSMLDAAHTMPARTITVEPFLLARHPLTIEQVRHWIPGYDDNYADGHRTTAGAHLEDDTLDQLLHRMDFPLPTEAEWEYAARAGTTTLTWRGDEPPGEEHLLDHFGDPDLVDGDENPFGPAAMGSLTELCEGRGTRGGAADLSPWQDCGEWLLMLPAARTELDAFTSIRPVYRL